MAARVRRAPAAPVRHYQFITLTSSCGGFTQAACTNDDDSFYTPEDAQANALARYDD